MSMITIIQVNPRLTSTFGPPTRDWGPKIDGGYDSTIT